MIGERGMFERPTGPERKPEDDERDFFALVETLDERTKATAAFQRLLDEAEDSDDFGKGLSRLRDFLSKRNAAMDKVTLRTSENWLKLESEDIEMMLTEIRLAMSYPERFLGNGATASVATLRNSPERNDLMVCAKVVTDYGRYQESMRVGDEMEVLDALADLQVEGVRTPVPCFAFATMRLEGYVMEELDAVNFRRVLEGQTTSGLKDELPENFDLDDFFRRLEAYVTEMHKRGILHNDLHLRNMMIDRKTGHPRIIDFGKARRESELDKATTSMADEAAKDLESVRLAKAEAREWLKSQA